MSGLVTLALLAPAGQAWADAIDGNWCFADGRRMSISGPDLVTPGGKRMTGKYDRHAFAYVVPEGEAGAGSNVFMVQLDEETIWVKTGAPPSSAGDSETWRRCSERIS
jgi:hypothetical protein